ncbi:uncharacterized protein SCHCODRAFT_02629233 [Schizophyllum commune H4-8]|uniref:uncharacterized protein n=1 Tax=Schizophyllum commune (strain H4-8 / FGSC 9210) TaxID=578458 RepID=UPI00215EC7A5|nr:uncharacterized protein SCHCODRAFT_02629233 [Schizophyllum commune H4-8]KAI5891482.1 hypothetical protein SCHCODRAFT_02629233 [Schizophyllum commune H4-8]
MVKERTSANVRPDSGHIVIATSTVATSSGLLGALFIMSFFQTRVHYLRQPNRCSSHPSVHSQRLQFTDLLARSQASELQSSIDTLTRRTEHDLITKLPSNASIWSWQGKIVHRLEMSAIPAASDIDGHSVPFSVLTRPCPQLG